jgi:hypothetical protein
VITEDNATRPPIRFGIGYGAMKYRCIAAGWFVELCACHQRQVGLECESIRSGKPLTVVFESRALACALAIKAKRANATTGVTEKDADRALHNA